MVEMKERIRARAFSSPILSAISAALFAVVIFSVPSLFKVQKDWLFALNLCCRVIAAVFAFVLAKICGFKMFTRPKITLSAILLSVLGLIVCVNNFPIIGFSTGKVKLLANPDIAEYLFYCVAIGVAEEAVFRGFVMPLIGIGLRQRKHAPFLTVAVSSGIFALCHLFNIFSAGIASTTLQVGYTFLTGCLFATVYLFTENIVFPIILHTVYDLGGLIFTSPFGVATGNMWDAYTVIITAVLGVITAAVFAFKLWNYKAGGLRA
nr:CPBP family intramembrane metalloprotease [Clostridia bacterium]